MTSNFNFNSALPEDVTEEVEKIELEVHFVVPFAAKDDPGSGNPAAVCIVGDQPISHATMSEFARFLSQPETIFAKQRSPGKWEIRNYTPGGERIIPGGNGTVALGWLLLTELDAEQAVVEMNCEFTWLGVTAKLADNGLVSVSLPSVMPWVLPDDQRFEMQKALDILPNSYYRGERDAILVYNSEQEVQALKPDFDRLMQACLNKDLPYFAFIATAPGDRGGFVYRTFVIGRGRDSFECPGSVAALMNLPVLWQTLRYTNAISLHADQLSERGGEAWCQVDGTQVVLTAACERYSGPNAFSFPIMGGEADCESDACTDPFIWV
jgi:predicted PhzF superfamily epimerase YddE/YHI9